jgi:hypothetical protein
MHDDKDIEISRLRGQVDALEKILAAERALRIVALPVAQPVAPIWVTPPQPDVPAGFFRCGKCGQLVPNATNFVHYCTSTAMWPPTYDYVAHNTACAGGIAPLEQGWTTELHFGGGPQAGPFHTLQRFGSS